MHSASNNNNSSSSGGNKSNCNLNCNQINFSSSSTSTSSLSCVKDHFLFRHSSPVSSAGMRPFSGAETDSSTETPHNNNPLNHPLHNLQPLQQQQQPQSYRGRHYHHYSPSNNRRYFDVSNSAQFDASAPPLPSPPSPLSPLQFLSPAASSSIPYEMSSNSSSSFLPCPTSPFRTTSSSFQRSGSVGSGGSGSVGSVIYVYEIPYHVRKEICDLLDADNSWRELGGRYMGFNDTQLTLISHALYRSASPTNELLTKWESSNAKVSHLYRFLAAMKHRRAMYRLLPYVDDKLKLLYDQFDTNEINQIDQQQQQQQQQHYAHLDSSLFQRDQRHLTDKLVDLNLNSFLIDNSMEATAPAAFNRSQLHHNNRQYSNNHHHINKLNNNQHSSLMLNHRQEFLNNNNNNINNNNNLNNQINLNHKRININDNNNNLSNNSDEERTLVDLDKKNVENANANNQINNNNNNNNNPLLDNKDQKHKNQTIDVLVRIEDFEISYKELVISTDDFCKDNILGSGGFGTVYIGEWKGTKVAVKKLKGVDNLSQALTELRILNCCRIDNILPLYAVSLDGPEPCLVYQYMPNGSLEDRLLCKNGTTPLSWLQRSKIAEGVARALNFLHTLKGNPFVHGDVKSANILLDPLFEPKLGDFGLARQVVKDSRNTNSLYTHCTVSSVNGTSVYLPAEYLRHKILSPAVDVYSYGIVVLEMATGRRAYDGKKLLINLVEDEYSRAQNVAAQNRVQSPLHHNPLLQQPQLHHSSGGGGGEQNSKLENIHQALMDKRIGHLMGDDRHWFNCLLELGRKCAHKTKSKRPIMIQILEYFNQCKTTDRIHKLCDHAIQNRHPLSKINFSKSNIKSPLELQLWYDFVRKSCGTLSEAVFENFGAQVTRMIEDIKFTFSNESAFHLDFLLNSQVPNNSSGTEASNSSDSGELNPVPIQSKPQVQGPSSHQSNRDNSDSNLGTQSNPDSSSSVNNSPLDGLAIESTNNQSPPPLSPVIDSSPVSLIKESIPVIPAINRLAESRQLPNIAGSLPDNIGSYFHPLNNSTVESSSNNNNPPLMHSHSSPSTSSLTIPLSITSLQSETATNNPLASTTSIPFIPLLTALGFNPSDIDDVLLKK